MRLVAGIPDSDLPPTRTALRLAIDVDWLAVVWFLGVVTVYLWHLGYAPLINPNEAQYAEIPREMLQRGEWITPYLNGARYLDKPPLTY